MAPKKMKTTKMVSPSFDSSKFVSLEAFERYAQSIVKRSAIPKRDFNHLEGSYPNVARVMESRG